MIKYRDHRGSLAESMATVQEFEKREGLIKYLKYDMKGFSVPFKAEDLKIEKYMFDERIGWDTFIVTIENFGVVGFTNGYLQPTDREQKEAWEAFDRRCERDDIASELRSETVKHLLYY